MKLVSLLAVALSTVSLAAHGQLVLNTGNVFTYQFSSLPYLGFGPGPQVALVFLDFNPATLHDGDIVGYEMFEDTTASTPFALGALALTVDAPQFHVVGGHWQDLQGSIRLTMLSGSVTVDSFSIGVISGSDTIGFVHFGGQRIVPVPEPGIVGLLGMAVGVGLLPRVCRRKPNAAA